MPDTMVLAPAEVTPLRQYKPHYTSEDAIKREMQKLGEKIRNWSKDLEGTKFAQLTVLAADYVECKMKETNDRSSIKERDIRLFIKTSIGYGDPQGRVSAADRLSTIEALLAVSAKAAFLFHHGFNGCDIRYFYGTELAKESTKGAVPRLAMPFNKWLPRIQLAGRPERIDNPDGTYKPLPQWSINAQYTLMTTKDAKLDVNTGRVARAPREGEAPFEKTVKAMETAVKTGQVNNAVFQSAAGLVVACLRGHVDLIRAEANQDVLMAIYELLERRFEEEGGETVPDSVIAEVNRKTRAVRG